MIFSYKLYSSVIFLLLSSKYVAASESQYLTISNQVVEYLRDGLVAGSISQECQNHVEFYVNALNASEPWAISMFDATTKLQAGVLVGNLVDFGHFDECLEIEYDSNSELEIRGRHCMVYANMQVANSNLDSYKEPKSEKGYKTLRLGFGICLPAACSPKEVRKLVGTVLSYVNLTVAEYDTSKACSKTEETVFNVADWTAICIFSLFFVLLVVSTIYDLVIHFMCTDKKAVPLYLAFSVYTNGKRIFKLVPNSAGSDNIPCIHGIRALSIIWIIFGHRYVVSLGSPSNNSAYFLTWITLYTTPTISSAAFAVDSFLVLGGLLLSFVTFKKLSKTGKLNIPMFYLHRYLRVTPAFAAMILFQATLMIYVSNGPYWKQIIGSLYNNCVNNWWLGLVYLQNYIYPQNMCVGHSWYLSLDMQLFILSPILLWPLYKWSKPTIAVIVALIAASIAIVFSIVYVNDYSSSSLMVFLDNAAEVQKNNYLPTHTRYGPWLLGFLAGYVLHTSRNVDIILNKKFVAVMWVASIAAMLVVFGGIYPLMQVDGISHTLESAFYSAFSRITWAAGLCWIIYACALGYGGPINWFLSLPFWQPLSRLSYSIYITHLPIQFMMTARMRTTPYFMNADLIYEFFGDFGYTLFVATIWTLAFEAPIPIIEKIIFKPKKVDTKPNPFEKIGYVNDAYSTDKEEVY